MSLLKTSAIDSDGSLQLKSAGTTRVTLTSDGNVGVDTGSPTHKLQVNGSFAATTKSFLIKHPSKESMLLQHGSLEGPENGVYVRGRLIGQNEIQLPDYWDDLVDEHTITVNLTPIGRHQKLFVGDISTSVVIIENDGNESIDCFYTVFAERKDVDKLIVEMVDECEL